MSVQMTAPIAIPSSPNSVVAASTSPPSNFHDRIRRRDTVSSGHIRQPKVLHPLDNDHLKILMLENISQDAVSAFRAQGFEVDHSTKAMSEDELVEKIPAYHAIGIRSKTRITARVLKAASRVRLGPS
jgi:D-3-phosphoglycerate dehydrogenase / 2-oxoglutarate reductase